MALISVRRQTSPARHYWMHPPPRRETKCIVHVPCNQYASSDFPYEALGASAATTLELMYRARVLQSVRVIRLPPRCAFAHKRLDHVRTLQFVPDHTTKERNKKICTKSHVNICRVITDVLNTPWSQNKYYTYKIIPKQRKHSLLQREQDDTHPSPKQRKHSLLQREQDDTHPSLR
jgi:hypothetical protein